MRIMARACGIAAVTSGAVLVGTLPAVAAPGTPERTLGQGVATALPAQDGISGSDDDNGDGHDDGNGDDGHDEDGHVHAPPELVSPELAAFDEELAEAAEEIEELREEAGRASARHERLRRKSAQEQADLVVLGEELKSEQKRLDALRTMVGQQAGSRYRAGGGAALAHLMFSETPEAFFISSSLIGRGEMTVATLLERTQESEQRLKDSEEEMRDLRADTAKTTEEQEKIREAVEEKLELAEERLAELEEAKAAAVERIRAERAAERREAAGGVDEDEVLRDATDPGDCAVSVRDDERLAEDAVEEDWTAPVHEDYTLTATYGQNGNRWASTHSGQDFAIPTGTPVLTIGSGRIAATSCNDAYGHAVVVEHENGYYSQYAHLSVIEVEAGQEIGVGQRLGLSGNTGNSSGPHLHFEIRLTPWIGSAINPVPWLRDHGVEL
ncbi:M23 family metallopeptidase [Streptomyces lonarensis]|uniref:M23 family metallopeptidase n=2 Tax=Streptomyces lonarensis TaxID=700599 RepID=A0A7X6D380_9ACTN|nr:M23 family metallopeptidase [Streptomyces lonarensis]